MKNDIFSLSNGEEIEVTDSFVTSIRQPLIPAGTSLICDIASATWEPATKYGAETIKIGLYVVEAGKYKDFLVTDKVKLFDAKPSVADKARAKLATYDKLCSGMLMKARNAGKDIVGDNSLLGRALCGGEVTAEFEVWELVGDDGIKRKGNRVEAIGPKSKKMQEEDKNIEQKAKSQTAPPSGGFDDSDFDDISF